MVVLKASSAEIRTVPLVSSDAPLSRKASVCVVRMAIDAVPAMPAESPPLSVAATESIVSDALAEIVAPPPALTAAAAPMVASVCLLISSRSRLAPTPAAPVVTPRAPARAVIDV